MKLTEEGIHMETVISKQEELILAQDKTIALLVENKQLLEEQIDILKKKVDTVTDFLYAEAKDINKTAEEELAYKAALLDVKELFFEEENMDGAIQTIKQRGRK